MSKQDLGKGTAAEALDVGLSPAEQSRREFDRALDWAERNVPDEHPPFAAAAAMTLKHGRQGDEVTADEVRARLRSQGRSRKQLA